MNKVNLQGDKRIRVRSSDKQEVPEKRKDNSVYGQDLEALKLWLAHAFILAFHKQDNESHFVYKPLGRQGFDIRFICKNMMHAVAYIWKYVPHQASTRLLCSGEPNQQYDALHFE